MRMRQGTCVLAVYMCMSIAGWPSCASAQSMLALQTPSAAAAKTSQAANTKNSDTHNIAGEWDGSLSKYRMVFKLEQAADGWKGTLTSVDQGNQTFPFDTISFSQGVLHLELKSLGASYEGKLSAEGTEINGSFQQGGAIIPLILRRPGTEVKTTLKARTIGRIPLQPCTTPGGNVEGLCGQYEVWENRQTQSGRKIPLKIMVLPATADKAATDPVFGLAGGPGQSAVEALPLANYITLLRRQRDIVLVDQRGSGGSNQLQCELRDRQNAQTVLGESYSLEKLRACRAELEKRADLTQYTTSIFADDLDEVRQAMGYDKVNLTGGSYGTKAALVYLHMHPEHVRTVTLDAPAPPQYRIPLSFSKTIQSSVDRILKLCDDDAACHKAFPEVSAEFKTVLDRLEKAPAHFDVQNPTAGKAQPITLPRDIFVGSLRRILYIPEVASQFPAMVHHAFQNEWTMYARVELAVNNALEKEVARGLSFSVICAEDVPGMTEQQIRQETAGTYLGDSEVRLYQQACKEWPQGSIPKNFFAPVHSDVPTLLITGMLDPATPPEASAEAARGLTHSRSIVIKQGTHGTGSPCIDGLIEQFVSKGSVAGLDASCADQIHLPPFGTR